MPRTLGSLRHEMLRLFIKGRRERAGLTQHQLARLLARSQSYVATIETGQRRIDVVELLDLGEVLRFDPVAAIRHLESGRKPAAIGGRGVRARENTKTKR